MLLCHSDTLSKTLQKTISAAEGQQVGRMVVDTLQCLRTEESYDLFWTKVGKVASLEEPQLPRRCKTPKHFEDGLQLGSGYFHDSPKAYYILPALL